MAGLRGGLWRIAADIAACNEELIASGENAPDVDRFTLGCDDVSSFVQQAQLRRILNHEALRPLDRLLTDVPRDESSPLRAFSQCAPQERGLAISGGWCRGRDEFQGTAGRRHHRHTHRQACPHNGSVTLPALTVNGRAPHAGPRSNRPAISDACATGRPEDRLSG